MESSDPSVTIDLLIKALIATGASIRELSRILRFEEHAPIFTQPIIISESKVPEGSWAGLVQMTEEASNSEMGAHLQ